MSVLCVGRVLRHADHVDVTIRSPVSAPGVIALWGCFATRRALAIAQARQAPVHGRFWLLDEQGRPLLPSLDTLEAVPSAAPQASLLHGAQ